MGNFCGSQSSSASLGIRSSPMILEECDARTTHYEAATAAVGKEKAVEDGKRDEAKSSTQVKIRITNKQLEELVNKYHDIQGNMSVEQVLIQLIRESSSGTSHVTRQRPWQPTLQTIHEVSY
ncbi:hypothetical protein ACLOJK_039450 [Asimina triloba]